MVNKNSSDCLIYIAVLFHLRLLHIGQTISEILYIFFISIRISKLVLHVSQWYIVIIDFSRVLHYIIYYYLIIYNNAINIFILVFNRHIANKSLYWRFLLNENTSLFN